MPITASIIIPSYNAAATIRECLEALEHQTANRSSYEVILVDDGSTDSTVEMAGEFSTVRIIRQENQGPAIARNNGAEEAGGDVVLFTDSDCCPNED